MVKFMSNRRSAFSVSRTFPDISGSHVPAGTIVILGGVEVFCGNKPADLRRQLRKAFALMVAALGRRVRRQEIAVAVWDDEGRDVRTLMWSLRRALRDSNSGFDVPPDKSEDGNYLLVVTEPGTLEEAVDAFRFLDLTRQAEALWKAATNRRPSNCLPPRPTCGAASSSPTYGLSVLLRRRVGTSAGTWSKRATSSSAPWPSQPAATAAPARPPASNGAAPSAARSGGTGERRGERQGESGAPGGDAARLAEFLIALHDRPGSDEADRLLAARRGLGTGTGSAYATGRGGS